MQIYHGMKIALSKVIKMSRILEMISLFRISLNSIENISGHCCHINSKQTSGNIVNEISSPILMLLDYTLCSHFFIRDFLQPITIFLTILTSFLKRIKNLANTRSWFEWYHFFSINTSWPMLCCLIQEVINTGLDQRKWSNHSCSFWVQ